MHLPYDEAGQGTPLLLIHGYPLDRTLWRPQLDGLNDVAHVIAPDLRGFGSAEAPPPKMTMEAYADDLKALLDQLAIKKAVICGLSMGGYVALAMLELYPDTVSALILCNTRAGADNEQARAGRLGAAKKVEEEGVVPIAEGLLPKLLSPSTLSARTELASWVKAMMERQPPAGVIAALRGMAERPDRTPLLPAIKKPTLIITGEADTLIPATESVAMANAIPGSKLVVIPQVAHLSNLEDPSAFNAAVRKFLERS